MATERIGEEFGLRIERRAVFARRVGQALDARAVKLGPVEIRRNAAVALGPKIHPAARFIDSIGTRAHKRPIVHFPRSAGHRVEQLPFAVVAVQVRVAAAAAVEEEGAVFEKRQRARIIDPRLACLAEQPRRRAAVGRHRANIQPGLSPVLHQEPDSAAVRRPAGAEQ